MPNINFDIFFDQDFINFTATRSQGAPKVKPAWKTRTAPKLPPKAIPAPNKLDPRPAPKLRAAPRVVELPDDEPEASTSKAAPKPAEKAPAAASKKPAAPKLNPTKTSSVPKSKAPAAGKAPA